MIQSKHLQKIQNIILKEQDLGLAIAELHSFCETHDFVSIGESLEVLANEYALMKDYMRRGFKDPMRSNMYNALLERAYQLLSNAKTDVVRYKDSLYTFLKGNIGEGIFTQEAIKKQLENFVQDVALLSLDAPEVQETNRKELYKLHYDYLSNLFNAIVSSYQWSKETSSFFTELLLSPTIEPMDARLLVSAIMLSNLQFFDYNKFLLLLTLVKETSDGELQQRALVGVAFTMPTDEAFLYPELKNKMQEVVTKEVAKQLIELQIQVFYCTNADADTQEIQQNIMPHLANQSGLKIRGTNIIEIEDTNDDDLNELSNTEENMEKVEESMRKMMDMQRAGSDIYFGGFAQMKRFSFFYRLMNWFCDFSFEHPDLASVVENMQDNKFFERLMNDGPFCDSDKYSFVLSLSQVFNSLPENMKEMMKKGEGMGQLMTTGDENTLPYKRRMYLQNLYRFFRLFTHRTSFYNPFVYVGTEKDAFFSVNPLFDNTEVSSNREEVAKFLLKKKEYTLLERVVSCHEKGVCSVDFYVVSGNYYLRVLNYDKAIEAFSKAVLKDFNDKRALAGLAQAKLGLVINNQSKNKLVSLSSIAMESEEGLLNEVIAIYDRLLEIDANHKKFLLNKAIAQIYAGKTKDAMAVLFKLYYEYSEDVNVKRALAWAYLYEGRPDESEKLYDNIIESGSVLLSDYLNMAYAKWFQSQVVDAIMFFKRYIDKQKNDSIAMKTLLKECFENDKKLLHRYNITVQEQFVLIDLVSEE